MLPGVPDLSITVINHSNPEFLRDCLRSIFQESKEISLEVIAIDNATNQRLVPEIQAEFPQVRWLFNSRSQGYSANHNQGLRIATGRYLCTLNDDTVIHDKALAKIVAYLDKHPEVGMLGPRLLNRDGTIQDSAFYFPTVASTAFAWLSLPGGLMRLKRQHIHPAQYAESSAFVDWVLGACQVVTRAAYEKIGGLDEKLAPIVYHEDTDWGKSCQEAGFKVVYLPEARLTHYGGQSTGVDGAQGEIQPKPMLRELSATCLRYFRKHHGPLVALWLQVLFVFVFLWNLGMITQSYLRRRLSKTSFQNSRVNAVFALKGALKP
jgi:N-acetylglucosaminyl-diphospho-decaprenol L-rhamnosyltransferase